MSLLAICLRWGFVVNLFLCFFNLLPIPPLDGGHVACAMFPASIGQFAG